MDEKDYVKLIREKCHTDDDEANHVRADNLLCEFLKSLGHTDIVQEFNKVTKWYA